SEPLRGRVPLREPLPPRRTRERHPGVPVRGGAAVQRASERHGPVLNRRGRVANDNDCRYCPASYVPLRYLPPAVFTPSLLAARPAPEPHRRASAPPARAVRG